MLTFVLGKARSSLTGASSDTALHGYPVRLETFPVCAVTEAMISLYCLLILSVSVPGQCREFRPFPLQDCGNTNIDILLVANSMLDSETRTEDIKNQILFFQGILGMLMPQKGNKYKRLKVAMTSAPYGLHENISFSDYKQELEPSVINLTTVSEEATKSSIQDVLFFVQNSFQKASGARNFATRVVLLLVNDYEEGIVHEITVHQNKKFHPFAVRIFVTLVTADTSSYYIPYTVQVARYEDLLNNQHFSMAICKRCNGAGWHIYEHALGLSCHKFHSLKKNLHWYKAADVCAHEGAVLAELETEGEIHHLIRMKQILHNNTLIHADNEINSTFDTMYIGLFKDDRELIRSFRWGNRRPTLGNHWGVNRTGGDPNQACAVWLFTSAHQMGGSVPELKEGWVDVGCGVERTNNVLCEVALMFWKRERLSSLRVAPANQVSYERALSRGEFIDLNGKIVSLSALRYNQSTDNNLPAEKLARKYFSCDYGQRAGNLISYSLVCDRQRDCSNNRDESQCQYRKCVLSSEFQCRSSHCIPAAARCDWFKDCPDGSDEEGCNICKGEMCCNGQCLPRNRFLDGEIDCTTCRLKWGHESYIGLHDEIYDLKTITNIGCLFICNRTECVTLAHLNNSIIDCQGPEGPLDEILGQLQRVKTCAIPSEEPQPLNALWAPKCVYVKDRFGGVLGCRNLAHLQECAKFACPEGYAKCPDSYCIPLHALQDGNVDCPMGEDEAQLYIDDHSCAGNFECWNSRMCLHPDLICDGHAHCPAGDDELNCQVSCRQGFSCIAGTVTVTDYNKSEPLRSLAFIDHRARYLDLSGVQLHNFFNWRDKAHFANMVEIYMSNCSLRNALGWFVSKMDSLETVATLDLSYNRIQTISSNSMFTYMTNLRDLNLSYNEDLVMISGDGLRPVSRLSLLEKLDLSGTAISCVANTTFNGLVNLRFLNLSAAKITSLKSKAFPLKLFSLDLRHTRLEDFETDSLSGLTIYGNMYTDNHKLCCPQVRGPDVPEYACHTTEDAISSCSDLVGVKLQRIILWLVGIIAVSGNLTVIGYRLIISRDTTKKAFSMFVTNLSLSDLIMGLYLLIIAGADMYYRDRYVWNDTDWRHSTICHFGGFLSTLSSETSTFFIFLITIDRYMALKFPFGQYSFSKPVMITCTIVCWSVGFTLALIPTLQTFRQWVIYSSNGMCLGLPLTTKRLAGWEYSMALFIVLNFFMFLIIACGQYLIYKAMSDNRMTKADVVQHRSRRVQDISVAKQLSLVALTNFLCWFPIGLMGILALSGSDIGTEAYAWSAVLILPINSALNPILYTIPILVAKWEQFMTEYFKQK